MVHEPGIMLLQKKKIKLVEWGAEWVTSKMFRELKEKKAESWHLDEKNM